jgi:hypothetical protein
MESSTTPLAHLQALVITEKPLNWKNQFKCKLILCYFHLIIVFKIVFTHCFFSRVTNERNGSVSEAESEEENEEGDYTVYECPGLASVSTVI